MTAGDQVAYKRDPSLYGPMEVLFIIAGGRVETEILSSGDVETFDPQELVDAKEMFVTPTTSNLTHWPK